MRTMLSPLKSPIKSQEDYYEEQVNNSVRYLVKVNVFNLYNPQKKYVLQHLFDEYFYVQQIHIRDKESLCYTLCSNINGEQLFFIWNFRKEIVIGFVEMTKKINKFVVTQAKSDNILFLGDCYLKYYEANFTNKIIKENNNNIIPMKIEKESNFIDMDYIPQKGQHDKFVLITDSNSIFIYDDDTLRHKIFDQFGEVDKELEEGKFESILSDSLDIGESSDRENISRGEEHLRIKSKGTNIKDKQNSHQNKKESTLNLNKFQQKMKIGGHSKNQSINDNEDKHSHTEGASDPNSLIKFQKLIVTQKGFIIGSANGYILCYEFKNDFYPRLVHKIHISNKVKAIVSMSISKSMAANDDFMVAVGGVYQKKVKKSQAKQTNQGNVANFDRDGVGSSSGKRTYQMRGNMEIQLPVNQNQEDFFMPNVIQSQKRQVKQTRGQSLDQKKRLSQLNFGGSQTKFSQVFDENQETEEKLELMIVNMKAISTQQHSKIVEKIYQKGAHDGSIFQISQCRNRSTFYSISEGQTLKLWNHTNEWRGVGNFTFDEQPLCIDVHPSSWQVAVGFKSGLKIYQSMDKELKLSFEKLGKAAFSVAYSDGGHLLACTNAVYIDIIDPVRMQLVITLFGHKGLVKNLMWTQNSKYLISSCNNGSLFFWRGNFKETMQKNIDSETVPIGQHNDKNFLYQSLAYDDDLDVIIALTSTSTLRLLINQGQDPIHEQDLLAIPSCQEGSAVHHNNHNLKATCMAFSKQLNIIVVGLSNGKISVISWPIIPNMKVFKYDISLQTSAITDVKFSYLSRYLLIATDDGNFYILETFRIQEGSEKPWVFDNQERLQLQKKRETHNFTGFSALDNIVMSNREVLMNVNRKIDKLRTMKKSQEINHEIKKKKTEKKYEKQMKMIEKELQEELQKQDRLMQHSRQEFLKEKDRLENIMNEQRQEHRDEKNMIIDNKEKNLNFVSNENDELETRILRLKETIVEELEKIESEHQEAVQDLVKTYESSVKLAQDEVRNTIDKLKQNGGYYENMITLQEKDYEHEVSKLQADLIEEHTDFLKRKEDLQTKHNDLKDEYQTLEDTYKERNHQRKDKSSKVKELQQEFKFKYSNVERLHEKELQSNIFIDEKEGSILDNCQEKKQLENLIVFLSEKIRELKDERKPLEERKVELQGLIEDTYRELQDDFQFRKYLELKEESLQKKMEAIKKDIEGKIEHKDTIDQKNYVFKRELSYLADAKNLKGWTHKMQGMLKCMMDVYHSINAEEVKKISMTFIHIAEIMESNSRPYRQSQGEEDTFTKNSRLNEMELAYYRNKNSEKMREMQFRYKALFSQMEKQIKKLRNDNIKLIEEFNTLINEKKKLNNLRKMIKESIKEFLGDKYDEEKYNSSDEEAYKIGGKKKTRLAENAPEAKQISQQSNQSQQMFKSKSTTSFVDKHAKVLQNNLTARESTKLLQQLPDLKGSTIAQVSFGGSLTQRDKSEPSKGAVTGFSMNKTQQLRQKRRIINSITHQQQNQGTSTQSVENGNSRYLERIVVEFEKNKRKIEEQTKNLQKIQSLADIMLTNKEASISQHAQGGAVPTLNLKKVQAEINSQKQTITTRLPNTTERTRVSVMDSSSAIGQFTNRKLPVVKEKISFSQVKDDTN